MTNDLKAKSKEFAKLGKKITQGNWDIDFENDKGDWGYSEPSGEITISYEPTVNKADLNAIKSIPKLISHIAELQKRLDDYEARVKELRDVHDRDNCLDLEIAIKIMTEGE